MTHPTRLLFRDVEELSPAERLEVRTHLATCETCAQDVRDLLRLEAGLADREAPLPLGALPDVDRMSAFRHSVPRFALAAALILVVALGVASLSGPREGRPASPSVAASDVVNGVQPDPRGRAVGIQRGLAAANFSFTTDRAATTFAELWGPETLLVTWPVNCADCGPQLDRLEAAAANQRTATQIVATVAGVNSAELQFLAQQHGRIHVLSDPKDILGGIYGRGQIVIVTSDGRVAQVLQFGTVGASLDSALAAARMMSDPGTVGEIVSVGIDWLAVRLYSPVMSAELGNPVTFLIDRRTAFIPATAISLTDLRFNVGDRVRVAWVSEGDPASHSYYALTVGKS